MQTQLRYPLWGKAGGDDRSTDTGHSALIAHILAVAACFQALLEEPVFQQRLESLLGRPLIPSDQTLLVWLAALHDIGKVDHRFQCKRPDVRAELLGCPAKPLQDPYYHGEQGCLLYKQEIFAALNLTWDRRTLKRPEGRLLSGLINASCAHHGYYVQAKSQGHGFEDKTDRSYARQLAADLLAVCETAFGPLERDAAGDIQLPTIRQTSGVSLLHLFAGLVSLADWVGSDEEIFPFISCRRFEQEYPGIAGMVRLLNCYTNLARQRFAALGIFNQALPDNVLDSAIETLLKDWRPRPIQQWIIDQFQPTAGPNLLLIEAPMGDGKTEAALLATAKFIDAKLAQGLVFALPTQASTNQNHSRLLKIGEVWFNYKPGLLHGKARLLGSADNALEGQRRRCADEQEGEAGLHFSQWVADNSKRAFLHPLCAATVDQLELGFLHSRHSFVRAAALARHVVILDEIHAYDAYMSVILDSLLHFLGAAAVPVILLSATLPPRARRRLLEAYGQGAGIPLNEQSLTSSDYPLLTWVNRQETRQTSPDKPSPSDQETKLLSIAIQPFMDDSQAEESALAKARAGACVCLLCNTVKSAQARYARLRDKADADVSVSLFHARFRFGDRADIERDVLSWFGPESRLADRQGRILVATQVVEQSLDLDFDYLITELAPVDLVLQRAGRMQRHRWRDADRPACCRQPVLGVILPAAGEPPSWFRATKKIYEESEIALPLTEQWLQDHLTVTLPRDIAVAVREVYSDESLNSLIERRKHKADQRTLNHEADLASPTAGQEHSSATRDADESATVLMTLTDEYGDDFIPVWDHTNNCWGREALVSAITPDYPLINPEYADQVSYWSLNLRKNSREFSKLSRYCQGTGDLLDIQRVECRLHGAFLEIGESLRYSIDRGLHESE